MLRRAPRDRRGLKALFWLLYLIGYFTYLIKTFSYMGFWGAVWRAAILGLAVGLALLMKRNHAQSEKSLISLSSYKSLDVTEFSEQRRRLVALLLRTAVLVDRAGIESAYSFGKAVEEHRGVSRRRTLDIARKPECWHEFTEEERGLLLASEGSWSWDSIWPRLCLIEDVRVLRWVVQRDSILVPFAFLTFDLAPALEITVKPSILDGTGCMPPWDLRPARDEAQAMLVRCIAEGVARGFFKVEDSSDEAACLDLVSSIRQEPGQDTVIGVETVGEASEDRIRWMGQMAMRRVRMLDRVIRYLGGSAELPIPAESGQEGADTLGE